MANVKQANKFFASYEPASHQGPECIHFQTHVNRSLTLAEAAELIEVLKGLIEESKKGK